MTPEFQAEAIVVGLRRGRPPIQTVSIDLTVEPPSGHSWLLVADVIGDGSARGPSGIHTIDRFDVAPGRSIVWLKGHAGVIAVPLAGGGPVVLGALPLRRWEELREESAVEILVADSLMLGETPLEDAFGEVIAPWPDGRVDIDGGVAAEQIVQRLEAPFDTPFSVRVDGSHTEQVPLRR